MLKLHPCGILFHANVGTCAPPSDEPSPERERFIELLLRDPAEARRERLRARVEYWRRRLQSLHERTELLRALLGQPDLEAGTTPLDRWRARVELAVARTDELEAAARLNELEYLAGTKIEPFGWHPAPAPAPAILPPSGPRKPGPKITCTCGECPKCRARENMRRLRAERKAAKAARKAR